MVLFLTTADSDADSYSRGLQRNLKFIQIILVICLGHFSALT
jgi:hypothetical protein